MSLNLQCAFFFILANGFEPLLVSDEAIYYDSRGFVHSHNNFAPNGQDHASNSGNIVAVRHLNMAGSSRNSGGSFQNRDRHHQNGNYHNANNNHNRDRRRSNQENRRNWVHSAPPRPFNGSCFICGKYTVLAIHVSSTCGDLKKIDNNPAFENFRDCQGKAM